MLVINAKEIWKPVPDWPEYEVSNLGKVKRVAPGMGTKNGRVLRNRKLKSGYLRVSLCRNSKKVDFLVHRLVASAYLDGDVSLDVCHFDGDRENCASSNLRYDTRKGNMADAIRHGTTPRGERCETNKHSEKTVKQIKKLLDEGLGLTACSKLFGIPISTVQGIKEGRNWGWLC